MQAKNSSGHNTLEATIISEDQQASPAATDRKHKVLVLDSGVGGLSICKHLLASSHPLSLDYFSDNHAFPYGEKSESFIVERLNAIVDSFLQRIDSDLIIIACNTASTIALPSLRQNHSDTPFVGVVPAIKTAAANCQSGAFALLATPGTVQRKYTQELIYRYAPEQEVVAVGSAELVQLVEGFLLSGELQQSELAKIIAHIKAQASGRPIDSVVLGCTHFPLVQQQLSALEPNWEWIESGPAIAARVESLLGETAKAESSNANVADCDSTPQAIDGLTHSSPTPQNQFWVSSLQASPDYQHSNHFLGKIEELGFSAEIKLMEGLI